jgi:GNAT superfamily N-acetyltransferase
VERAVEQAAERGVPLMWWAMEPEDDLYPLLKIFGFEKAGEIKGMAAEIDSLEIVIPEDAGYEIREVENLEELEEWNEVMAGQFGFPGFAARASLEMYAHLGVGKDKNWRHFTASDESGVIAVSSLFSGERAVMIGGVAVLPEHRNKGLGTVMTAKAAAEARRGGHDTAVILAGPEAEGMYRRMGFETYAHGEMYLWKGFAGREDFPEEYAESVSAFHSSADDIDPHESRSEEPELTPVSDEKYTGGNMNDEQSRSDNNQQAESEEPRLDLSFTRSTREIAAAALVGAIIAVLTLVVIFFSFRGEVTDYGKRIETLDERLTEQVTTMRRDMDQRITVMEERLENISDLPEQVRRRILLDTVGSMRARMEFMRSRVEDEQLAGKLDELESTLGEIEERLRAD